MEIHDFLKIYRNRIWLTVFLFLVILLSAAVYCVITPEHFKSTTTILIIPQRVPESYVRSTVSLRVEDRMATIQQQILSRTRLMSIMDDLGLYKELRKNAAPEDVVEMMRRQIEISVKGKDSFSLSFSNESPHTAMMVTSRLVSFFIDENLKTREMQAVGTSEFIESQLEETKKKLEAQEEVVKRYKTRYLGELPQQMEVNLSLLRRLQDQYRSATDAIRSAEQRRDFLEARINLLEMGGQSMGFASGNGVETQSGGVAQQDPAQPLLAKLSGKQALLADLSRRYTEGYPEIAQVRREIAQLEKEIAAARSTGQTKPSGRGAESTAAKTPTRQALSQDQTTGLRAQIKSVEMELVTLKSEAKEIQKNISNVQSKVEQAPKREQEMISIVRDYENLKRLYDELLRKKLDAQISQNLEIRQKGEQFQIIDPPNLPQSPFKPDRRLVLSLAFVAALAAGFGLPLGLEFMDPTLRDRKTFRAFFDFPVIGSLPIIRDEAFTRQQLLQKAAVFGGFLSITAALAAFLVLYGEKVRTIINSGRF